MYKLSARSISLTLLWLGFTWERITWRASWSQIQYGNVILSVHEILLWRWDGHKVVLSPQWFFLYWQVRIVILNARPWAKHIQSLSRAMYHIISNSISLWVSHSCFLRISFDHESKCHFSRLISGSSRVVLIFEIRLSFFICMGHISFLRYFDFTNSISCPCVIFHCHGKNSGTFIR